MPIVQITLVEGRDTAVVKNYIKEVARTVSQTLNAPLGLSPQACEFPGLNFRVYLVRRFVSLISLSLISRPPSCPNHCEFGACWQSAPSRQCRRPPGR